MTNRGDTYKETELSVLHLNNYDNGGGAETVFNLTRKNLEGVKNYYGYIKVDETVELPDIEFNSWEDNNKFMGTLNFIFSFKNYKKLRQFLKRTDIDIIHLHAFMSPLSPAILLAIKRAKKRKRFKVIETQHGYHMVCPNMGLFNYKTNSLCEKCVGKKYKIIIFKDNCDGRGYYFSFIKGIKNIISNNIIKHREIIDIFIAPSEFLKNKLVNDGINPDKIAVIRNPIILQDLNMDLKKENLICYFGRLSREKNLEFLIKTFAKWKKLTENDFKLLIIGDGEQKLNILRLINKCGYQESIEVKKFMSKEKLMEEIKTAKYFSMTSKWYENAPMTIWEAMSLNILSIVPDIGGMRETIELISGIGKCYYSGNESSWIETINQLEKNYTKEIRNLIIQKEELIKFYGLKSYIQKVKLLYQNFYN